MALKKNGGHFPDSIFKYIFLNENLSIAVKNALNFVPKVAVN